MARSDTQALIDRLQWAGFEVPMAALLALGAGAVPALLEAAGGEGVGARRAATVLGVQLEAAMPLLRAELRSLDVAVVVHGCVAVRLLAGVGRAQVQGLETLRDAAFAELVSAGPRVSVCLGELVPDLIAIVDHPEPTARSAAIFALWTLGDPRAVGPLLTRISDPDPDTRHMAIYSLGYLGDSAAAEPLLSLASDPAAPPESRVAALGALGTLGDRTVVEPLLAQLALGDGRIASAVASALGNLRDERALPALLAMLDHPDEDLACAAVGALGTLGDRRALGPLQAKRMRAPRRLRKRIELAIRRI